MEVVVVLGESGVTALDGAAEDGGVEEYEESGEILANETGPSGAHGRHIAAEPHLKSLVYVTLDTRWKNRQPKYVQPVWTLNAYRGFLTECVRTWHVAALSAHRREVVTSNTCCNSTSHLCIGKPPRNAPIYVCLCSKLSPELSVRCKGPRHTRAKFKMCVVRSASVAHGVVKEAQLVYTEMDRVTLPEMADIHLVYEAAQFNSRAAAHMYRGRYPNRGLSHHSTFTSYYRRLHEAMIFTVTPRSFFLFMTLVGFPEFWLANGSTRQVPAERLAHTLFDLPHPLSISITVVSSLEP
ncbi:hypothetical protein PR048_006032 [Dryococelus australis]|uniref:Uncharacterized protein n=1 Tax=Dryococelus australis TaxID=614101 RepID=A0ABQ9I9V6_9NEOP|nr:hypothetical protein PR048_006032 [Dryococelus australis]